MLLEDENCPVPLETLGLLYRMTDGDIVAALSKFTPLTRARLALYCAQRSHLRAIGLNIASTCDFSDLYTVGGKAGAALYEGSRSEQVEEPMPQTRPRRKITLATRAA
jgi:hypothetical protein